MPKGSHALIVEDELIIGMGLQTLLTEFGFESFAFASTETQAVEQAKLRCPDLVTVDIGLMAGNGQAAVRAIEAECGPLPVLYVTGSPEAVNAGPRAAVLSKPVSRGALAQALQQLDHPSSERNDAAAREESRDASTRR